MPLVDGDERLGGAECVEYAPLTQPREHLRWSLASEDGEPTQFVGLVTGAAVGEHVRACVLDTHQATGASGDLGGEFEEVADATRLHRLGAELSGFRGVEDPQHHAVDTLPSRVWVDVDDRDREIRDVRDRCGGRRFEHDCDGHPGAESAEPPDNIVGVDADHEEQVGVARRGVQWQVQVIRVDECDRGDRDVEAAGCGRK